MTAVPTSPSAMEEARAILWQLVTDRLSEEKVGQVEALIARALSERDERHAPVKVGLVTYECKWHEEQQNTLGAWMDSQAQLREREQELASAREIVRGFMRETGHQPSCSFAACTCGAVEKLKMVRHGASRWLS